MKKICNFVGNCREKLNCFSLREFYFDVILKIRSFSLEKWLNSELHSSSINED